VVGICVVVLVVVGLCVVVLVVVGLCVVVLVVGTCVVVLVVVGTCVVVLVVGMTVVVVLVVGITVVVVLVVGLCVVVSTQIAPDLTYPPVHWNWQLLLSHPCVVHCPPTGSPVHSAHVPASSLPLSVPQLALYCPADGQIWQAWVGQEFENPPWSV